MFSPKEMLFDMKPYERSQMLLYCSRPYLVSIATELGISAQDIIKKTSNIEELTSYIRKAIRVLHKEVAELTEKNVNQRKEIERRAQLAFQFMEQHVELNKKS